jgi:hypothetical protein
MVMGEASLAAWNDELHRNGRVVFTLRPRAVLTASGLIWLAIAVTQLRLLLTASDASRAQLAGLVIVIGIGGALTGLYIWRLATRYPALTVDHRGIRVGRKRFLPWAEVGAVGLIRGGFGHRVLPIIARDPWGKDLTVNQMTVRNVPALADWLEQLLRQYRA